jgi:hypothetical protein
MRNGLADQLRTLITTILGVRVRQVNAFAMRFKKGSHTTSNDLVVVDNEHTHR